MLLGQGWVEFLVGRLGKLVDSFFAPAAAVGAGEDAHVQQVVNGVAERTGRIALEAPADVLEGADVETSEVVPEDVVEIGETGRDNEFRPRLLRRLLRRRSLCGRLLTVLENYARVRALLGEVGGGVEGGRQDVARLEGREGQGVAALG